MSVLAGRDSLTTSAAASTFGAGVAETRPFFCLLDDPIDVPRDDVDDHQNGYGKGRDCEYGEEHLHYLSSSFSFRFAK